MKETFDELMKMLNWMKHYEIRNNPAVLYSYRLIEKKVKKLQDKYNESIKKESVNSKNTEMTALEYFTEQSRMTKNCCISCKECGISSINNEENISCTEFEYKYPERAVAIVQKWSEEHPRKTILQDFLEKYPKAMLTEYGEPINICPYDLGYEGKPEDDNALCNSIELDDCKKCWDRPLGEEK